MIFQDLIQAVEAMALNVPFVKMNGAGNAIIVADLRGFEERVTPEAAIALAQADAIPFDQLMEIRSPKADHLDGGVLIHNSDGSQAGACGNGMRCIVAYMNGLDNKTDYLFRTKAGELATTLHEDGLVTVDMGMPKFDWEQIPLAEPFFDTRKIELQIGPIDDPVLHSPSAMSMGNPQIVFWVDKDVNTYDLHLFGPLLENHPILPDRANITIAQVVARDHIIIRTWERGAGLTLACGSAACAALVCAVRKELTDNKATITVPGGDLTIEWAETNHVLMTGPTEFEFSGMLDPITGEWQKDG